MNPRVTLHILLAAAVPGCAGMQEPADDAAFPSFAYHRIDHIGRNLGQTSLADVDDDGDLDWVAGEASHSNSRIWWWEYRSPDDWVRHDLGSGNTDVEGAMYDGDGDGDLDMLSGSILLINTGRPRQESFSCGGPLSASGRFDNIIWENFGPSRTPAWREHVVSDRPCHEPEAADVDGDVDIVAKPWSTGNEHYYLRNLSR